MRKGRVSHYRSVKNEINLPKKEIASRFLRNSEALASEFLEDLEEMFYVYLH